MALCTGQLVESNPTLTDISLYLTLSTHLTQCCSISPDLAPSHPISPARQLVESNPILTDISDCMTAEGKALAAGDTAGAAAWCAKKADANERLQKCSAKFNGLMKALREKQSS